MKHEHRLSEAQLRFLRAVRDGTMLLSELRAKFKIEEKQFGRWMRSRMFRAAFRSVLLEASERGYCEMQMAANVARSVMASAVRDGRPLDEKTLAACREAVATSHRERREREQRVRRLRSARGGKKRIDPERDLCHPSMKHRRDELLAGLEEK